MLKPLDVNFWFPPSAISQSRHPTFGGSHNSETFLQCKDGGVDFRRILLNDLNENPNLDLGATFVDC